MKDTSLYLTTCLKSANTYLDLTKWHSIKPIHPPNPRKTSLQIYNGTYKICILSYTFQLIYMLMYSSSQSWKCNRNPFTINCFLLSKLFKKNCCCLIQGGEWEEHKELQSLKNKKDVFQIPKCFPLWYFKHLDKIFTMAWDFFCSELF